MPSLPAWTDDQLQSPHTAADKAARVQRMFSAIAPSYDLNNRVHSLGRDQAWRRAAVKAANLQGHETILDAACGTGDLTLAFHDALLRKHNPKLHPAPSITGADFTSDMLTLAARKAEQRNITWLHADALALPLPSASIDIVSIAFGLRNITDPPAALREFARVLKPNGQLIILEFIVPQNPLMKLGYRFYCEWLMPRTATLLANDQSGAYKYLPRSVATFPNQLGVKRWLQDAGYTQVQSKPLTAGIACLYTARIPVHSHQPL